MFTRMAKGVLIFFEVVVVLAAIGLGLTFGIEEGGAGFLIFLLVLAVGFLLIFFFGLFVELCNNVMDIRQAVKPGEVSNGSSKSLRQHFASPEFNLSKIAAEYEKEQSVEGWYCRFCGTKNTDKNSQICASCGKER